MQKWVIFSCIWGIGGSMDLATRTAFSNKLSEFTTVPLPNTSMGDSLIDYEISLED